MQELTKTTSRKFYNKWLYKVTVRVRGAAVFRQGSFDKVREACNDAHETHYLNSLQNKILQNKKTILEVVSLLEDYNPADWTKRIEADFIDLYTNNLDLYNDVSCKLKNLVVQRFEPNQTSLDLLDDSTTIIAKKLPHDKYEYKVYLLPHKMANDREGKKRYVEWLKSQSGRITCTRAVEEWFIKTDWNWDRRYVLVDNEQTLLMLKLRNAEVVGRVYKYIVTDK